jgi:hypothetical protein
MTWAGYVACMGERRNTYNILVGKLEGNRPLGRQRHKLEDNLTIDLKEMAWEGVDWIHMAQDRDQWWVLVDTVMNHWVP